MRAASAVLGVCCLGGSNFAFIAIAHGQQHVFSEIQVATLFTVVLKNMRFDNGIDRATLFAETSENALGQVDVITGRPA